MPPALGATAATAADRDRAAEGRVGRQPAWALLSELGLPLALALTPRLVLTLGPLLTAAAAAGLGLGRDG